MNSVDAVCQDCKKPIRWLPGLPLLCAACSQKKASQAFFSAILMVLVSTFIAGCVPSLGGLIKPAVSPTPGGYHEHPMLVPKRPFTIVQACLDITGSYPYADFKKAEGKVADAIDQFVRPNTNGLVVYANLITANSWQDDSAFFTERIDAIAPDPAAPVPVAMPTATGNVFLDKQHEKQAEQAKQAALLSYQSMLKQRHAQLALLRHQVQSQTNALRSYSPPQSNIATDVVGCLERAAKRMQGVQGEKLLLVASDLQQNTLAQDVGTLDLSGIRVVVIYHYCADAATCQQVNAWFTDVVMQAKGRSVSYYDVAQSDILSDVFSV